MAIAIVSSTSQIGNSAVVSVPKPATVNNNDILIAFIGRKATTTGTLAFPAGWIKYELNTATGNDVYSAIAYMTVPNAAALTPTFAFTSAVVNTNACWIGAYSGVNQTSPEDVSFTGKWGNIQNGTAPFFSSVNTVDNESFGFGGFVINYDAATTIRAGAFGTTNADDLNGILNVLSGWFITGGSATGTASITDVAASQESQVGVFVFKANNAPVNATATPSLATIGLVIQTPTVTIDYNDHTKDPSCVGAWLFTEGSGTSVDDSSANSNTGNFKASSEPAWDSTDVPFAVSGAAPNSVTFDGGDDYIRVTDHTSLNIADTLTYVAWIKQNGASEWSTIISKDVGSFCLFFDGTDDKIKTAKHSTALIDTSLVTIDTNWHHIAVTKNGSTRKLYVDGVEDTGFTGTNQTTVDNAYDLFIGQDVTASTHTPETADAFIGNITEVAIFNRALTLAEIQDIYNYGLSGVQGVGTTTATPSLASVSVSAQTATASKSESRTASPSLVSISIVPQTPTITISKSSVAVPSLASVSVSISTPNVIISQSRIAVPSLASISIVPQTATASTIVTQSSTATPSIVSITVSAQTPTISTATVTNASPSLSSVSVVAQTPTPKISNSAIAVPSVASISVSIQTAVASQSYSATATPTLTYISVLMLTPTPSKTESRTASPLVQNISVQANTPSVLCYIGCVVQVNTVYLSTSILQPVATTSKNQAITATVVHLTALVQTPTPEVHQSRVASPSIIQATIFVNSATTEVHKSASVTPSIATLSVQPQIATATSSRSVQVSPQTILMAVVTQTAVASTSVISSSTAFPIQASARITVHDPTIYIRERGVVSGIDIDIYLQSAMANRINVLSRMDKLILYKSAMEKKIYNKSRMGKRIDLDSEMETTIFGKSKL